MHSIKDLLDANHYCYLTNSDFREAVDRRVRRTIGATACMLAHELATHMLLYGNTFVWSANKRHKLVDPRQVDIVFTRNRVAYAATCVTDSPKLLRSKGTGPLVHTRNPVTLDIRERGWGTPPLRDASTDIPKHIEDIAAGRWDHLWLDNQRVTRTEIRRWAPNFIPEETA